jgi:hypothetical protein
MSNTTQPILVTDYDALVALASLNDDQDPDQIFLGSGADGEACCMSFEGSQEKLYFLYAPMSTNYAFDALDFPNPAPDNSENRFLIYMDDYKMDGCLIGEISPVKDTGKTFSAFKEALSYFNQCVSDKNTAAAEQNQ